MKLSVYAWTNEKIIAAWVLLPTRSKNGLNMEGFHYTSADNNICNAIQLINLPWNAHFELVNRSAYTVFSVRKKNISVSWLPGMNELKVKYTRRLTFFKILFPNCTHLLLFKNLTFTIISLIYFRDFMINCRLFKKTIAHSFAASSKSKNAIILQRGQWKELCLFCFSSRTHLPLSS